MGYLATITDSQSCEEAIFDPNPFIAEAVDILSGPTASQSHTIDFKTPWDSCTYTPSITSGASYATVSLLSSNRVRVQLDVTGRLDLVGMTQMVTVQLTPDYIDDLGLPGVASYSFSVSITSACQPTILSLAPVASMLTYVDLGAVQQLAVAQDTVSVS